jgi:hypothetical protein
MKKFITILLLGFSTIAYGQTGNYFLSHYTPTQEHFDNICFDMAQDERGVMHFATNGGVLQFDGRNWDMLKGPSAIYALHINAHEEMYWGGARGFGKVGINNQGFQQLEILSDSTATDIFQALSVKEHVYFLSEDAIYVYDPAVKKTTSLSFNEDTGSFGKLFEMYGAVYASAESGIFKVEKDKLTPSKLDISGDLVFFSRLDDKYVFGTGDNKVYVCTETLQPKQVPINDQDYLNASVVISGSWVNRQLLALGTLRGGVLFINPITGATQEIVNYATGLPDNEVVAMMADRNQNVWIAHDYGFTRISPYMPFRTFSHYAGLQGNPLCAYSHDGSVYTGTSLGLFKLERENVYDELIYYENVEIKEAKKTAAKKQDVKVPVEEKTEVKPQEETRKRGLFNFLKKNKDKNKSEPTTEVAKESSDENTDAASTKVTDGPRYRREKRTRKVLRASQYVYVKVNGIDSKITQLVETDGRLIASGLGGIYDVNGLQAKPIQDEPVRCLYASDEILFASTYDDRIVAFDFRNGWHMINSLNNLNDQVNYIFEGKKGELWLCGLNKIYQLEFDAQQITINRALDFQNQDMDVTLGVSWDDKVMFVNPEGFFEYNRNEKKITRIDSLTQPAQYFTFSSNVLYRNVHGWNLTGKENDQGNLQLLNLFHDLRFIAADEGTGDLWMISRQNELYKFYGDKIATDEMAFPLFLKTVTNDNLKTASRSQIHISEDKSAVTFEIVQPDYVSPEAVEFRYQLQGMNEIWSDWAGNNNKINFPYLPPGQYTLMVQSRNIFGKISELEPMIFEVLPPYWKRSWFYAMEFAILASMVLLSFRLNSRYRIVSRVLSLLTIILLIQFIQTIIDATIRFNEESPVIDFIIQVIVALLILPVEGFLRNLMFRSLDTSSKFYQFITPKGASLEKEKLEEFETSDKSKLL